MSQGVLLLIAAAGWWRAGGVICRAAE